MNRYKQTVFSGIMIFSLCFLSSPVWAGYSKFDLVKKVSKERMAEIYEQLDLSEQQKKSLEVNREKNYSQVKKLKEQARSLKRQLKDEIGKPQMNEGRIQSLKAELNRVQSLITDSRLKGIMEVRDILTPQQYEYFHQKTSE